MASMADYIMKYHELDKEADILFGRVGTKRVAKFAKPVGKSAWKFGTTTGKKALTGLGKAAFTGSLPKSMAVWGAGSAAVSMLGGGGAPRRVIY